MLKEIAQFSKSFLFNTLQLVRKRREKGKRRKRREGGKKIRTKADK